ncbi:MAG: hypothetical protein SVV03_00330 [Candidatus Nanohaloarchaea archaeon]|nr:hypothetical protein [Candidatus Nanohaloarchaea archaeon]
MFDKLEQQEIYGLVAVAVILVAAGFGAGTLTKTGKTTGKSVTTDTASKNQIRQKVQSLMDRQMQRQRQQLKTVANRSENLSIKDLSIGAEVSSVGPSRFGSLQRVNVTISGTVPRRLGSGTRDVRQTQTFYISSDGRYLFQQPRDLEQPRRRLRPTTTRQ